MNISTHTMAIKKSPQPIQALFLLGALFFLSGAEPTKQPSKIQHYAYFAKDRESLSHTSFLSAHQIKGAQVMYAWKTLEPTKNNYDFRAIEHDLAFLKSKNKTLFVQLQDASFNPKYTPLPNYLMQDQTYHGGAVYQYDAKGKPEGWVARRWDPEVQKRFKKLLCALGKRFDNKIAGLNLQETSVGIGEKGNPQPSGFTPENYRKGVLTNMQSLRGCFSKSVVMQYANFMPGEWLPWENKGHLDAIFKSAQDNQIAVGAPDLMPHKKGQQNHAYQKMNQGKNTFGIAVQDGNYLGKTNDLSTPKNHKNRVPKLYQYATKHLHVSYIFWAVQEPFFSQDLIPWLGSVNRSK